MDHRLYCRKKISNNSFVESNLCMDSVCFHYFHCCFAHWRISKKCGSICCHSIANCETAQSNGIVEMLNWKQFMPHEFEAIQIGLISYVFLELFQRKRRILREKKYKIRGSVTISNAVRCDISQKRCVKQQFHRCISHLHSARAIETIILFVNSWNER